LIQYARKLPTLKFIGQKFDFLPRLSAGSISLIYACSAGSAIPYPMPTIVRPAMKPSMLRGVRVEMKAEMMTITHPVTMAHRRPKVVEMDADMKTPNQL